jgi:transcriptional regulator with XRE-family HTH domain
MNASASASKAETVEVKKRRLRTALRQARSDAKMTQKTAAAELVWSTSKIVRIEQGTVPVTPTDTRVLLQLYNVPDDTLEELVELAKAAREDKGWSGFSDVLSQPSLELVGSEPTAKVIYKFEPSVIPGLFQTQEYARALLRALGNSEYQIKRRLDLLEQRQRLLDSPVHPDLNFILGEAALSRPAGGEDVMREQAAHLLDIAKINGVSVHLLPFAAGVHPGIGTAFTVLQFDDPELSDMLYLENPDRQSVNRDNEEEIDKYLERFVELQDLADKFGSLEDHVKRIAREHFPEEDADKSRHEP